jgi:transcription initiation factor TFIID subunit 5
LLKQFNGHEGIVYSLDFSKDGSILASGSVDCSVKLWDVKGESNVSLASFSTKQTPVYDVHFSWRNLLMVGGAFQI